MWKAVYYIVTVLTYVLMLVSVTVTGYYVFISYDWQRAVAGGLFTLLIIYVNKVNPK